MAKRRRKRVTLVSLIDEESTNKVKSFLKEIKEPMCKVPYGIDDENRYEVDTLPYHFTVFATYKENEEKMLELMQTIKYHPITVEISDIKIKESSGGGYVLYLAPSENEDLRQLQTNFYEKIPTEKTYNPETFLFHMSLHMDYDYDKIVEMQEVIRKHFRPFTVSFHQLGLFDYPGDMLAVMELN